MAHPVSRLGSRLRRRIRGSFCELLLINVASMAYAGVLGLVWLGFHGA